MNIAIISDTHGQHTMQNTHPFRRALGRRTHLFAHNGTLEGIDEAVDSKALSYLPIGDPDSELAFCTLLSGLKPYYDRDETPSLDTRLDAFCSFGDDVKGLGPSNFLYL